MSDSHQTFIAGTMGGFAAKLFEYPLDTIKVLLQTQQNVYRNAWHCFQHTVQSKGFASLYKGLSSPLLGCMAENALLFSAYAHTKKFAILATTSLGMNDDNDDNSNNKTQDLTLFQLSLAGAAAGTVVPLVLTPVELIKCRIQVQNSSAVVGGGVGQTTTTSSLYKGPLDVVWRVWKQEGIRGLYKGNVSTLLREVPGNFVWFGCYEGTCLYFIPENGTKQDLPLWVHMLGGAFAGVGYWTAAYPLDTVKSRMQTQTGGGGGLLETFRYIWRTQGMRGFYCGWGVTMIRAAPGHALIFAVYEQTMKLLNRGQEGAKQHILTKRRTMMHGME